MSIRENLETLFTQALDAACKDESLQLSNIPPCALERPRDEANGDWASTVALRCSKEAHKNPRDIAQIILDHLPANSYIESTCIAGPGFINIKLSPSCLHDVIQTVRTQQFSYGKHAIRTSEPRINLEFVSANPTGPLHVGHGRWAVLGDAIARVMTHAGYQVYREFYINDQGVQMDVFGNSVVLRYLELLGEAIEIPEAFYGGAYVIDIAKGILASDGDTWLHADPQTRLVAFRERAYREMLAANKETLENFHTNFDCWFSERSLYIPDEQGKNSIDYALEAMRSKGYIYEKDGATWFRSTAFDDTKDRVLIKENGEYTYFMSDMAYHHNKLERGFGHLIDLWGADHHGYIKRCEAMLAAWGCPGALEVVLGQLVNLFRDGETVRMSKRTGEMITFQELIDEVGVDATRYTMLSRSSDQPIDFDIEVVKKQDASNPVYYVQYAHARICAVLRKAAGQDVFISRERSAAAGADGADTQPQTTQTAETTLEHASAQNLAANLIGNACDLSSLTCESELALMRKMADFPELISIIARDRAPFKLTHYAQDLAALFHQFYTECRIIDAPEPTRTARLALCDSVRIVLALTLSLMGVSAPEKM